jgi:hypothetical protein
MVSPWILYGINLNWVCMETLEVGPFFKERWSHLIRYVHIN